MFRTIRNNPTFAIAWVIVHSFLVGAAVVSFNHIVLESGRLGITDWQRFTVPFLIDGIAVLGKIGRSSKFDPATQRAGLVLMCIGGALSLTANVLAGANLGYRIFGGLLVGAFVLAEWFSGRLYPAAPQATEAETAEAIAAAELAAKRSASARKAAATRAANKKRNAPRVRKPRAAPVPTYATV